MHLQYPNEQFCDAFSPLAPKFQVGFYFFPFAEAHVTASVYSNWASGCTGGGTTAPRRQRQQQQSQQERVDYIVVSSGKSSAVHERTEGSASSHRCPSTDGKRYLEEVSNVVAQLLIPHGYCNVTISNVPDDKDHIYGYSAYDFIKGERGGPVATYLQTSLARKNFQLKLNTYVWNVIRNGSQITGVKTNDTGVPDGIYPLKPGGRVILSAGTYGSARIFLRSGIGPTDMINLVKGDPVAGPLLPPEAQWINLLVGFNVSDNPSINPVFTHPSVCGLTDVAATHMMIGRTSSPPGRLLQTLLSIWLANPVSWHKPHPGIALDEFTVHPSLTASRLNFWQAMGGTDGVTRWVGTSFSNIFKLQGTARPGAASVTTKFPDNQMQIFKITAYLSSGIKSRGRIGINTALNAMPLVNPWLVDPVDKLTLITGLKNIASVNAYDPLQQAQGWYKEIQGYLNCESMRLLQDAHTVLQQCYTQMPEAIDDSHWDMFGGFVPQGTDVRPAGDSGVAAGAVCGVDQYRAGVHWILSPDRRYRKIVPTSTLPHGILPLPNPHQVDPVHARIGIQNWATLGTCGQGMQLNLILHQTSISPSKTLPYEHVVPVSWEYMLTPLIHLLSSSLWSTHPISMHELEECAKAHGVKFR
ncbi:hypothetical protein DFH08DRAFT_1011787 [Mycena albidolilacea]|uniref:Glucose-methanol-choline oxidoreductase N-terminal domain-containing protein n=1 Tax=Mycena albidolilacea TaxID=1033008 RepID=A0AAD6ZVC0_9AGAR|nr:hypothetical protein DFH08DRAFT_1011787 [Mycena albidolilacea]